MPKYLKTEKKHHMAKQKKIGSKRLSTTSRTKISRKGSIKLPNKRLLKNINKGKCHIPKNALLTETEKESLAYLKQLEEERNKSILRCVCESSTKNRKECDCFVSISVSISCSKEPIKDGECDINVVYDSDNKVLENEFIGIQNLEEAIKNLFLHKTGTEITNTIKLKSFINDITLKNKTELIKKQVYIDNLILNIKDKRMESIHFLVSKYKEKLITKHMIDNFFKLLMEKVEAGKLLRFFRIPVFESQAELVRNICDVNNLSGDMFSVQKVLANHVRKGRLDWQFKNGEVDFILN